MKSCYMTFIGGGAKEPTSLVKATQTSNRKGFVSSYNLILTPHLPTSHLQPHTIQRIICFGRFKKLKFISSN
ncbi:hypothetical protein L1987_24601 [Smallanthus sonchifolius]|uniref:Uncharacterized protein n=1 Tax=Smallanthus sonchifolius TaxID=185202 RepID=A0ACB9IK64_9ASTR|nr:hypothetical protein L1987_24601 [Smallanthus sonchifolius]